MVTRSRSKDEFKARAHGVCEILGLKSVLRELNREWGATGLQWFKECMDSAKRCQACQFHVNIIR